MFTAPLSDERVGRSDPVDKPVPDLHFAEVVAGRFPDVANRL